MLLVQKFGGSSVATTERIVQVAKRIAQTKQEGHRVAVVVSAMGDATDDLLELAASIRKATTAEGGPWTKDAERELDALLATGEQVSAALLALALQGLGIPARSFTGWQAGVQTSSVPRKARLLRVLPEAVQAALERDQVAVVSGFQGCDEHGTITTLGRGGSDLTAVALAAALSADACEIFSDVDGIYTADPRRIPRAQLLEAVTYEEMLELASLGSQVLQARAVELAEQTGVTIQARSTFTMHPGTSVSGGLDLSHTDRAVRGVAIDLQVAKLGIIGVPDRPGIAARVLGALAEHHINVDVIVQSVTLEGHADLSLTVNVDDLESARAVLERVRQELGARLLVVDDGVAKVSIVGVGMVTRPGVAATFFAALSRCGINIHMISTSEIKVSVIVAREDAQRAAQSAHSAFGLDALD